MRALRSWALIALLGATACSAASGARDSDDGAGGGQASGSGGADGSTASTTSTEGSTTTTGGAGGDNGAGGNSGTGTGGNSGTGGAGPFPGQCDTTGTAPAPVPCASVGIQLAPTFAASYECFDIGDIPNVPKKWGGITAHPSKPGSLLLGGNANQDSGALYEVGIERNPACHILGFTGASSHYAGAQFNDGGVAYGPNDVLFLARWPNNELGLLAPGSANTNAVIKLGPLGVQSSISGLAFVPDTFGGAGQLKAITYGVVPSGNGHWYTLTYVPDGNGLFNITSATKSAQVQGGPEGFVFVKAGNPNFAKDSILVSEWNDGKIAAYELDDQSNPIPTTRREFLSGFSGPEGALLDPFSGDFVFSTFDAMKPETDHAIVVRGFARPPPMPK